ncbi:MULTISPECIES: hypothetical protein [Sphingomonas]|uniref:hypothetical protein n=1 Tax=Sphingomonas TaxID=13687 RepID=UPI001269F990|nr:MULTISPECIES: hypothetical protein [Sphingomonas]
MRRISRIAVLLALAGSPAVAAPRSITILNGTGAPLSEVSARPQNGGEWSRLTPGLSPGARTKVTVDPDLCAYDVRARAGGADLVWRGVNLCETNSVTLSRRGDGALWVDYD